MTEYMGWAVIVLPMGLLAILATASLVGRPLSEQLTGRFVQAVCVLGLLAALTVLAWMLWTGNRHIVIDFGNWAHVEETVYAPHGAQEAANTHAHFHFALKFVFDRLSVPFVILSYGLCGTIGAFANRYLHREPGFNRFFVLFAVFLLGMVITSLAGTIESLFAGWELVGVSSALLIAFFQERTSPVRNGLRVWAVYRVSDAALLIAAVVLHHLQGEGDFAKLFGNDWPAGQALAGVPADQQVMVATTVGFLILLAAAGKSALVPFSGWLPRAMEGPTPSSAVFYGALSVHLGAFLLLRISPIFAFSPWLTAAVIAVGLSTALFAAVAARVQTDIKSALSFASLTQVGLIVAEIGCGLRYLALAHIIGHACLRTLQFLRAGSVLQDFRMHENALQRGLGQKSFAGISWLPEAWRAWVYRFALERGYLDAILADYVARPIMGIFRKCDSLERRWTDFLAGGESRESDRVAMGSLEDLT